MWFGRRDRLTIHVEPGWDAPTPKTDVPLLAPGFDPGNDLSRTLVDLGLEIVHEVRGPMRLWDFARRLEKRLGMPRLPAGELSETLKATLERIDDPRLGVLATSMPGVGYVYDTRDPDARPVRASR